MLPERSPGKQRRRCWFKATQVTSYVTIRSAPGYFLGHWSGELRRTFRCCGDGCHWCDSGEEPRVFVYVFVELESGEVQVFNLPERLHDRAREWESSIDRGVGIQLAIRRDGPAMNSRIEVLDVGLTDAEALDIQSFVDTLGMAQQHRKTCADPIQGRSIAAS